MITSREGTGTVLALVTFVAGVQLDMPITATLVLERSITVIASVDCIWIDWTIGAIVWA